MPGSTLLTDLRGAYRVELADSPALLREAYRLRYQVYVVERGHHELPCDNELEIDEFDPWAHHVLIRRLSDGELIGATRLVPSSADHPLSLPIQHVCSPEHLTAMPLGTTGEVSRFVLSKHRRAGGDPRLDSLLLLNLVEGVLHLSLGLGLTHWCAVMERSLMRLLRKIGIHFMPLGPLVECHGRRQPALAEIATVLDEGERQCPLYHEFVTRARHAWRPTQPVAYRV